MKFGLTFVPYKTSNKSMEEVFRANVEQVLLAEQCGFDSAFMSEHHFLDNEMLPSPFIALAFLAAATSKIRLGTGVLLMPLHNPLRVAEDAAVLDRISGGRLILGIGQGYRPEEFKGYGRRLEDRRGLMREGAQLVRKLWTEEHVTHRGAYYQFEDATLLPQPVQHPGPPIWIAGRSDAAMKRAAILGDGWYPTLFTVRRLKESNETVRTLAKASGRDLSKFHFGVSQTTSISEDPQQALAVAVQNLGKYATAQRSAEDVAKALSLTGTTQNCIKGIHDRIDAGVRHLMLSFLSKDEQDTYRQMELVAKEVIPYFR